MSLDPLVATNKMSMGGMGSGAAPAHACKISMLWNWYTIDTCFIARSWHVKSKGMFAGSCVGVFFLVMASQWLHRFCREYDAALVNRKRAQNSAQVQLGDISSNDTEPKLNAGVSATDMSTTHPVIHAVSHKWLFAKTNPLVDIVPSFSEHLIRSILFTLEWFLSFMIMLLFMYYNGYIIISCLLGALFGRVIFTFNERITCQDAASDSDESDRKCCK